MTQTDDPPQEPPTYTLEKFAQHPFYHEVNERLVKLTGLRSGQHVVDVGAGTGAVTRLLAAEVAPGGEVTAVEPSETAIEAARRSMESVTDACIRFIQGTAEKLTEFVRGPVDAVFFCNAFHLVEEKEHVLKEVRQALGPDGTFSFNTSFYQGAEPPEAEPFYRKWMMKSLRALKSEFGVMPDKTRVEARHRLTEDDYITLLESNGFKVKNQEVVQVEMPLSGFESISEYSLWIEGVLPGVPLEAGARSLTTGAREAFLELGIKSSPRNWLLVVASRA